MQRFISILTLAQIETSLSRLDDAQKAHEEMLEAEEQETATLVAEIARVKLEATLEKDSLSQIYLSQLEYDLSRVTHNQARRVEMLVGRRKTIELFLKWDSSIAA